MANKAGNEAFEKLQNGNDQYRQSDVSYDPKAATALREKLTGGQSPHTAVLTCADSRVPAERIFAGDLGELFVVRVAGNIADTMELASLEYAVAALKVPQILVLGHTACGAVAATVDYVASGNSPGSDSLLGLVKKIKPAVETVQAANKDSSRDDTIAAAIQENVRQVANNLKESSPIIGKAVADDKLTIRGAVYNLGTGEVRYLDGLR